MNMQRSKLQKTCSLADTADSCSQDAAISTAKAEASAAECCELLRLPVECVEQILHACDAQSLVAINQTCSALHAFDTRAGLRLVEKIAKIAVIAAAGEHAGRWRRRSWLAQLFIEDSGVGFANFQWGNPTPSANDASPQYRFLPPSTPDSFLNIRLDGMGPKLLVSDLSTADQPVLRWRLVVRGNTAVEFGVVPLCLEEDDKALHKCTQEEKKFEKLKGQLQEEQRPQGFCSSITVGSLLPFKTAIMKGSVVELLARRGRLEILVQNPPDGQELYWHNTRTVPKPYKGPREVRFEQDFSPDHDIKLALTSWAHGAFDVLHPAPGSRVLGPQYQQAWDGRAGVHRRQSSSSSRSKPLMQPSQQQQLQRQAAIQPGEQQVEAAVMAATAAAAAEAQDAGGQHMQQQRHQAPGSPGSDESTSSQEDMMQ